MSSTAASPPLAGYTIKNNVDGPVGPLQKFLKEEPKALGTVQIMTGMVTLFIGILFTVVGYTRNLTFYSGICIWGGLVYIVAGSLTVAASNKWNYCLVHGTLTINVINAVIAGIAIIIFSMDIVMLNNYRTIISCGVTGVLLVLSALVLAVSITISAFACKATCFTAPPWTHAVSGATASSPPTESLPKYTDIPIL